MSRFRRWEGHKDRTRARDGGIPGRNAGLRSVPVRLPHSLPVEPDARCRERCIPQLPWRIAGNEGPPGVTAGRGTARAEARARPSAGTEWIAAETRSDAAAPCQPEVPEPKRLS